jgi:hypothetical protein
MIDLLAEPLVPLKQAAKLVPAGRGGRPTHFSTVLRWVLTGVQGPSGERVRLEAVRLGGRWLTSREALQRFAERLTPGVSKESPEARSPSARRRAVERAENELRRIGI